jgi:hypothetical protein
MLPSILCADEKSNYFKLDYILDIYTTSRSAFNYKGSNLVICHPPCAQFSRMRKFSKTNKDHLDLAAFCVETVKKNGGILEHPAGSNIFKLYNLNRKKILSVDQSWWGFPCRKRTYLYFENVFPLITPISFNLVTKKVTDLHSSMRSRMPISFCKYLVDCCIDNN